MKENLLTLFQNMVALLLGNEKWIVKSAWDPLIEIIFKHLGIFIKNFTNYDFFSASFNRKFFLKNFLKNLILLDFLRDSGYNFADNILDVGCGAAPASIALSMLVSENCKREGYLRINLLDKSHQQLELATALFKGLSIEINSCQKGKFHFSGHRYNQLVLFSYFICEQKRSFIKLLYKYRDLFKYGCIILDYKYVIDHIKRTFEQHGDYRVQVISLNIPLRGSVSDILQEKEVKIYGCYFKST